MDVCTLGLRSFLLFSSLLLVSSSVSQRCVPQSIPDMVIDISQAVARGARFTDPLSVPNVEECVSACCMSVNAGGDLDCNLVVFDTRKDSGFQNCYIFHCPTLDSCPLSPAAGVLSYSIHSETSRPENQDPDKRAKPKSSDRSKAGKTSGSALHPSKKPSVASQGSATQHVKEGAADSSKSITSQLLHLADKLDQHLEKMESDSQDDFQVRHPSPTTAIVPTIRTTTIPVHREEKKVPSDAKMAKPAKVTHKKPDNLKVYLPTETAKMAGTTANRTVPSVSTAAPQPVPHTAPVSSAKKVPSSDGKNAKLPGKKISHPLPSTEGPPLTTRTPKLVTHPAPLRTSPWRGVKPSTETIDHPSTGDEGKTPGRALPDPRPPAQKELGVNMEETSLKSEGVGSGAALPSLEDKSGLVAALVFGMLFLMVVIGLVSRKVSEARRRHQYTKLDYLINGMYVDT